MELCRITHKAKNQMKNSPKVRQAWMYDLLQAENLTYSEMWGKYGVAWGKGSTTFDKDWNASNCAHLEYQKRANAAKEQASIEIEVKALKDGLNTKTQRLLFYQGQIQTMEKQLIGEVQVYFIVGNKPVVNPNSKGEYILPLEKQNEIRRQIKEYQTEISKIVGDYAPAKLETKDTSELSPEQRSQMIKELTEKLKGNAYDY